MYIQALEAAIVSIVGETGRSYGPEIQALSLKVVARMAAAQHSSSSSAAGSPKPLPLLSSPDAADDFLTKLTALRETCFTADSSVGLIIH